MRILPILAAASLSACATAGPEPSLAPRAAEAIDPRVPIPANPPVGPVDPALAARIAQLMADVRQGAVAFDAAAEDAGRLASAAGPAQSESWIEAQQALSALVAARAPVTRALGDLDALAAAKLESQGGIAPGDLAAIEAASSEANAIGERQATTIARLQALLAS